MEDIRDLGTPSTEDFPKELEEFIKNNPNMRHENLYLCKSVDTDGNVVDTKIGVNLMTNWGLAHRYITQNNMPSQLYRYMWLGRGQSEPDPASSSLTSYISELSTRYGYEAPKTYYPFIYDRNTKIWSVRYKISQQYWDYTQGNNEEYQIYELGIGLSSTQLFTHALIYDAQGKQTCILKKPNTRLYITAYWTYSISVADIPSLYEQGKYVYIKPTYLTSFAGEWNLYFSPLTRETMYGYYNNGYTPKLNCERFKFTSNMAQVPGDPRETYFDKGPDTSDTRFWEQGYWYFRGMLCSTSDVAYDDMLKLQSIMFGILTLDGLPEENVEELETQWCYTNSIAAVTNNPTKYTGNESENLDLYKLSNLFGLSRQYKVDDTNDEYRQRYSLPYGILPCVDFSISEISMYNHITKEWDIDVPFIDKPEKLYLYNWNRFYIDLWVSYKGKSINVYVYINAKPPYDDKGVPKAKILSFNNSGMVIAATDEYWDVSTYEEIPNLSNVPDHLSRKRYYVVVSGTNAELQPQFGYEDQMIHQINLPDNKKAYELTHDENGVMERLPFHMQYNGYTQVSPYTDSPYGSEAQDFDVGSQPLFNNEKGWFLVDTKLVFLDRNRNCTTYDILIDHESGNKYSYDHNRRYCTEKGDKVILFYTRNASNVSTITSFYNTVYTYQKGANNFSVFTITDKDTQPTKEDVELTFTDNTDMDNNTGFHMYSWSNKGFLVAQKKRTDNEFVVVNVYGDGDGTSQYIVQNAKHCRALNLTKYCVYQDTNLSMDTRYIFNVYDMENREVVNTITIDDGSTYTIEGIHGWREFVYIRAKSSDNIYYTFFYNIETDMLERLTWSVSWMDSRQMYWMHDEVSCEECMISCTCTRVNYNRDNKMYIITSNEPTVLKTVGDINKTNVNMNGNSKWYPCINTINEGRQLIFTVVGNDYNVILDLGYTLDHDDGQCKSYPYERTKQTSSNLEKSGFMFPFLDGVIVCSAYGRSQSGLSRYMALSGRLFYLPIECCIPMHMKGTTHTLNSYNAPVRWGINKKLKYNITNDLSRLIPDDKNGG